MRPLEIVIPLLLGIYLVWPLVTGRKRTRVINLVPAAALLLTIAHLLLEKYRWQMIPIYVMLGILLVTSLISLFRSEKGTFHRKSWSTVGIAIGTLFLVIAVILPVLLPVPSVPPPSGPFKVGTETLTLSDPDRKEIYSQNPNEPRKFLIQIWYPASPTNDSQLAPWMPNANIVAPAIADWLKLPHFSLNHLELASTSSYLNAPVDRSGGPYPVLIFSHGWGGFRAQNTFQVQELASQGYIVVGMEHTYGSTVTVFPNGEIVYNNPEALPADKKGTEYDQAAQRLVNQWTGDISYALDSLTKINANDPQDLFTGMINLDEVGVFGHSTGGGATIQFCATDPRCKAGLTMDAFMTPVTENVLDGGVKQPFLFMFSQKWPSEKNTALFNRFYSHVNQPTHVMTILGTSHYDFSDLPMLSPLAPMIGLKGPLNASRVLEIIDSYSVAFFDQELRGKSSPILQGSFSPFTEVRYDH